MIDFQIVYFLNHLASGTFVDKITVLLSSIPFLALFWFIVFVLILYFDRKDGWRVISVLIIAIILHFIITEGLFKQFLPQIFGFRLRPYLEHANIIPLGVLSIDAAFPSGHVSSTMALSTVFAFYYRRFWPFALVLVISMAFSRIHNGMHYLTDVLAGGILGFFYGLAAVYLVNYFYQAKRLDKKD